VVDRAGPGPLVAGRRRNEDARRVGVEEGQLDRITERLRAAGDREVDHVDPVQDCLANGGRRVGVKAALDAADLVLHHPRAGRESVDGGQ
jgi:hypothetical protein